MPLFRFPLIPFFFAIGAFLFWGALPPKPGAPPDHISPAVPVPTAKGLIQLFGGKEEDLAANWVRPHTTEPPKWTVKGGAMTTVGGDIQTKENFTDYQLHVEFKVPYMPTANGQGRGNS